MCFFHPADLIDGISVFDLALGHGVDLVIHVVDPLLHQPKASLEVIHVLSPAGRYGVEHDNGHGSRDGKYQENADAILGWHVGPGFHRIHAFIYARGRCSHQTKKPLPLCLAAALYMRTLSVHSA